MELNAGEIVDRYTIEGPIGRGGMAIVYKARHNQLGTVHAIKVLTVGASSIKRRLLQEGRAQATLAHPNIVNVTDVIDVGGSPGLVMELIDGPSMDDFLQQVKLTFDQADELAQGVIAGVAEAHRHGLIHRDLKPANVMLKLTARGFVPKVTDFGLAKALGGDGSGAKTRSGAVMGTPYYMAPEQIRDSKNVDQRADIFSLGAMLYEMLAGERPFEREDILETYTAIASGNYVPLDEKVPDVPARFAKAVHGALAVKADDRPPDCETLLALWTGKEIVRNEGGQPQMAGPWSAEVLQKAQSLRSKATGDSSKPSNPSSPSGGEQTWQDDPTSGRNRTLGPEDYAAAGAEPPANISRMYDGGQPNAGAQKAPSKAPSSRAPASQPPPSLAPRSLASSDSLTMSQPPAEKASRLPLFLGAAVAVLGLGLGVGGIGLGLYAATSNEAPTEAAAVPAPAPAPPPAPAETKPEEPPAEVKPVEVTPEEPPAEVKPEEPPPAEAKPAPKPKASAEPRAGTEARPTKVEEAPKAAGSGTLVVNSRPYSDLVTIDGNTHPSTPWNGTLSAGKHKVSLHANDGRSWEGSVDVVADQKTIFCWDFDKEAQCSR
jgi:serine/threonine protein kinase